MRKKFYRQAKKAICIATLSATVLTSIPVIPYTAAYAKGQTTMEELQALSLPTENAITYKLSDKKLITEKTIVDCYGDEEQVKVIEINITENGNYIIQGTNVINEAIIDTHIVVKKGVKANIILDGVRINNEDSYADMGTCGDVSQKSLFPILDIEGTANLYVQGENTLISSEVGENGVINITGDLTIKESEGMLVLVGMQTTNEDTPVTISGQKPGNRQAGNLTVVGGNIYLSGRISDIDQFTMTGGNLMCKNDDGDGMSVNDANLFGGSLEFDLAEGTYRDNIPITADHRIYINGGSVKAQEIKMYAFESKYKANIFDAPEVIFREASMEYDSAAFELGNTKDIYGNEVDTFELAGLPGDEKVAKINGVPVTSYRTTSEGKLTCVLEKNANLIEMADGKKYVYDSNENQINAVEEGKNQTHTVTLKFFDENETEIDQKEFTLPEGFVFHKESNYYDGQKFYDYLTEDGKPIEDIRVDQDCTLRLEEKMLSCTIDGEEVRGQVLPEGSMYYNKTFYCINYAGERIEDGAKYEKIASVQRDGKWYIRIQTKKDLAEAISWVQTDLTVNFILEADIDYEGETQRNGILSKRFAESKYYGTFDGDGHTISNGNVNELYFLAQQNYGTIKNLHIKDMTILEQTSNTTRSGFLCASNYGTIENCSVENCLAETVEKDTSKGEEYYKNCIYGMLAGGNYGTIKNSFASNNTFTGKGETYPLAKSFAGSKVEYTYYQVEIETPSTETASTEIASTENDKYAKTAEQFASGEVCSLLNQGVSDGSQYWHQNIDNDGDRDAVPVADPSHETVYAGYRGCTKVYSNDELQTTPSHEIEYTAEGNTITGICKYDSSHNVQLTVSASDVTYDGKAHPVTVGVEYSDEWGEEEVPYELVYTRGENPTEDLTSPGTIKAMVFVGPAHVEVTYTIKAAPTATPPSKPSTTPGSKPGVTPGTKPSVTPDSKPTATPGTKPSATPDSKPSVTPPSKPSTTPDSKPSAASDEKPSAPAEPSKTPASEQPKQPQASASPKSEPKGTKLEKDGNKYTVTSAAKKNPKVKYTGSSDKTQKKVIIPKTVTIDGVEYQVTSIDKKAFRNNKSLKEVVIGKNIKKIATKAFYGCKNLRKVTFRTTVLSKKSVGSNAFGHIYKKARYLIPSKKWKNYREWLKKRGATKQQTFQKY